MINWNKVYREYTNGRVMKFEKLPTPIPWCADADENLRLTVEWLVRDGRDDVIRLNEEDQVHLVRNNWFKLEFDEGHFIHVCYPEDMLGFRRQYESIYFCINEQERDGGEMSLTGMLDQVKIAKTKLWSAWRCMGGDGMKRNPVDIRRARELDLDGEIEEAVPYSRWERKWSNNCSVCCEPLPKALQMWVKLQHTKLKDAL